MTVYVVMLNRPNAELFDRVRAQFADTYVYTSTIAFFCAESMGVEQVAIAIGLKGVNQVDSVSGVVFELTPYYAGYTSKELWSWLRDMGI